MSRVEENEKWIRSVPRTMSGNREDVMARIASTKLQAFIDISRSLAIIANSYETTTDIREADLYVRDNLLIQWMLNFLNIDHEQHTNIEDIYHMWLDWLHEKEAEHE